MPATRRPGHRRPPRHGFPWLALLLALAAGCGGGGGGALPEEEPPPAEPSQVRFEEVTAAAGLAASHTRDPEGDLYEITGQAFGDVDGDGWLDLYVTDIQGPNTLYRNQGDGTFAVSAWSADVALADLPSGGAVFVDYDNDGDKDLYVCNFGPNALFRNTGSGFEEVATAAGVAGPPAKSKSASWADFDGDGWLDLYVANWGCDHCDPTSETEGNRDRLYRARGDGTFEDVSAWLGVDRTTGFGFIAVWLDFDNDGDLDIYLANDKGIEGDDAVPLRRNVLWRNDGPGPAGTWRFTERAVSLGADQRRDSMGIAVGDLDHDGRLDLAFTHRGPSVMLRNTPTGFEDVSASAGIDDAFVGWGLTFQDWDHDGWLDLYVAASTRHNKMWLNRRDMTFRDISATCGANDPAASYGVACADYDRDGHLDLVVGNYDEGYRLFRCLAVTGAGARHHWARLRLVGGGPVNRDAVGARVTLRRSDGLVQMQEVKCGSSLGAGNDLALHFGLGTATIESLEVRWPDGRVTAHAVEDDRESVLTYPRP